MVKAAKNMGRVVLRSGPWNGVRNTAEPFDDPPNLLVDARNGYMIDPKNGSALFERPGFSLRNMGDPVFTSVDEFTGQAVYSHPALDGSTINFMCFGGHLFRVNDGISLFEDVTPVGVTIDPSASTRVFFASLIGQLIVTDGVNRPWIATNLTSTPVTGTYIDYDGLGGSWSAYGKPALYGGAIFFILNAVNGVSRRTDLAWCEPGQPAVGYQQANFDNNWTLETASSGVLYAIQGTNTALYYWRELSIGTATGTVGPDLASTATEDSIGFNVGAQAAQTIQQFGNSFLFCDAIGRPWRLTPGSAPEPIWYQLRAIVDQASIAYPTITAQVSTSIIEPTLNKWLVGIWSPNPATGESVTALHCFDAATGIYEGFWEIGPGINIDCVGTFTDAAGRVTLVVLGSKDEAPATSGYVWTQNSLASTPQPIVEEDLTTILTTEDGVTLTTEGQTAIWQDNGELPDIFALTGRMGYSDDTLYNPSLATAITATNSPVEVAINTSAVPMTVEGTPSPSASQDGTYRLVVGCRGLGRGVQLKLTPQDVTDPWALYSVSVTATTSKAGWQDA